MLFQPSRPECLGIKLKDAGFSSLRVEGLGFRGGCVRVPAGLGTWALEWLRVPGMMSIF